MKLQRRLTTSYVLVALVAILLASAAGALLVRAVQVRAAERSVRVLTALVTARAEGGAGPLNQRALERLAASDEVRLLVVEPDGTVAQDSQETFEGRRLPVRALLAVRAGERPRVAAVQRARFEGQPYFFGVLPSGSGPAPAQRLVVAIPSATLLDSWLLLLPGVLGLSALGVAVAGGVGAWVSRRLAQPIGDLTAAARRMAEGDYEARVPLPREGDELHTLASTFNTMADEVQAARQVQRDFLANVSHDLRTPLTSIQGFSQALMDGTVPEDQGGRVAAIIFTEAARLTRLVQDLLDLARIEAGRFSMAQRDVNLQGVLERCTERFRVQAEQMGVDFVATIPRRALPVHGDADRLEQVVTNLVDNALSYAQDGGGHVRLVGALGGVRGSGKEASNGHGNGHPSDEATRKLGRWWVEIKVEDDGPGIADEQKPLLFERFYRADNARSGGVGLGLAIAREIVQAHGGDIFIEDAPEQGTQFVVRLPLKMR